MASAPGLAPLYLIAVASDAETPGVVPHELDRSAIAGALDAAAEAEARGSEVAEREHTLAEREAQRSGAAGDRDGCAPRASDCAHDRRHSDAPEAATDRLRRVDESVTWQPFQRVRARVFALLGGEESRAVQAIQATLQGDRGAGCTAQTRRQAPTRRGGCTARAPRHVGRDRASASSSEPVVSIVIPLYAHAELTRGGAAVDPRAHRAVRLRGDPRRRRRRPRHQGAAETGARRPDDRQRREPRLPAQRQARRSGRARALARAVQQRHRGRSRAGSRRCSTAASRRPTWRSSPRSTSYPDGRSPRRAAIIWRDGTGAQLRARRGSRAAATTSTGARSTTAPLPR